MFSLTMKRKKYTKIFKNKKGLRGNRMKSIVPHISVNLQASLSKQSMHTSSTRYPGIKFFTISSTDLADMRVFLSTRINLKELISFTSRGTSRES